MDNIKVIIFYILLIDSIIANIIAWFGERWYMKHFKSLSRIFPIAKGWTGLYLALVLLIGYLLRSYGAF